MTLAVSGAKEKKVINEKTEISLQQSVSQHKSMATLLSEWQEKFSLYIENKTTTAADRTVDAILTDALNGTEITEAEAIVLFQARGQELDAVLQTAATLRQRANGNHTSFVVTRNINFTNICSMGCTFCGFARNRHDSDAQKLSLTEIARRAREAWQRGASEVCIQGGINPQIAAEHYRNIVLSIKDAVPDIHIHAFSPFEIWFGARKAKLSVTEFLQDLKQCGLGSMPGTAAEILDTDIRRRLTRNKLSAQEWVRIVTTAHMLGIPTTATIMYGHIDAPHHWAAHIGLIREIQKHTRGFTEFVPLGFVHHDSPLYLDNSDVRPGPSTTENLLMHAVARIMLQGYIDNIQVSWVKLGPELAKKILTSGANDMGGTLMNESISRAAGARYGQEITPAEMDGIIRAAGQVPVLRNTLYQTLEVYDETGPSAQNTLVQRNDWQTAELQRVQIISD